MGPSDSREPHFRGEVDDHHDAGHFDHGSTPTTTVKITTTAPTSPATVVTVAPSSPPLTVCGNSSLLAALMRRPREER